MHVTGPKALCPVCFMWVIGANTPATREGSAGPIATAERLGKCYMHSDSTAL